MISTKIFWKTIGPLIFVFFSITNVILCQPCNEDIETSLQEGRSGYVKQRFIYWVGFNRITGNQAIFRWSIENSSIDTLVSSPSLAPSGIAIDTLHSKMYWTDNSTSSISVPVQGRIFRSDLDGSNREEVLDRASCGFGHVTDIELDLLNGYIFWGVASDCGGFGLRRANLDGSDREEYFVQGRGSVDSPPFISLDILTGKIYWKHMINNDHFVIGTVSYDGSELNTSFDDSPQGLTNDPTTSTLYWTKGSSIYRASVGDVEINRVLTSDGDPQDLELDLLEKKVYWTEYSSGSIWRANLDGSNIENVVSGLDNPYRMSLDFGGSLLTSTEVTHDPSKRIWISQNFPNPFSIRTNIPLDIPFPEYISLKIFDLLGKEMVVLANGFYAPGQFNISWNAAGYRSGVYICKLTTSSVTRSILLTHIE